ncbi:hypothetical protein JOB18_046829 [Solea senegalensis]|uniref:Uncharacterized protein n=1 Tax=Solea senegalensis TaxID=28829 RepID=A0AAV6QMJ5_SOLSE|nr:hypothetical protein JOB18_046829 [Solea senegalensis]KAG7490993.1 hypothetical protein JOB18_046829 [Solea senegalensis]KAG7490994.1 hypothetical protein JOB18_046829 [Solea senegalensis]
MSYVKDQWKQCVLKNDELFVTIDSEAEDENKLKLCTKDIQGSRAPKVWICTRPEGERIHVAFRYMYEQEWYIAKVEENHLQLQLERFTDKLESISESCWFQAENQGLSSSCCLKNVKYKVYLYSSDHKLYARQDEKSTFTLD